MTPERTLLEHLVFMATLAPSVHNTQPWRFHRTRDGLLLHADSSRRLGVLDPDARQLVLSCGAALHHLVVAARAADVDATVTLLPQSHPSALAQVTFAPGAPATAHEVELAVAVLERSTVRGRFDDDAVPTGVLEGLALAAEQQGAALRLVRPEEAYEVAALVSAAERWLAADPAYRDELAAWTGVADDRPDGIPDAALDTATDRGEVVEGRRFHPGLEVVHTELPVAEHPAIVVLVTRNDGLVDRLRAGMSLSRVLLEATAAGLAAQPLGQVTDVPATRLGLAHALGLSSVPQLLLRLGRATPRRTTLRRPVEEVLS